MIEINGLKKTFGSLTVLEDINIRIPEGDIYGLVGKSGAGKSTLLHCINGLERYDAGSLKVGGVEVGGLGKGALRDFRKEVAMIFQSFNLMSRKTVYENIAFPMRCWKYPKAHIDRRVMELAELVGITDKLGEKPDTLSGGQKQRVAIARALAMEPKILLSDEATSALDPVTTQQILQLLREINRRLGITIIIVTHQMAVVRRVCKNVSLLQNGRITVSGPVEKLFLDQPEALRRFMGEEDIPSLQEGTSLQIMLSDQDGSKSVLGAIARELDISYRVVGGKIEQYQQDYLGSLVINVRQEDAEAVMAFLDDRGVIWHPYAKLREPGNGAKEVV